MLTKEQLNILSVLKKDLFANLTFKQIKTLSKQKSNNIVQIALKEFQNEDIVKTKNVGDVTTYQLDLDNNLTISYLNLINELELKKRKIPKELLSEIQKRIFKQTKFFILIVFGSYAKNKATAKSDLDVAIIVDSEQTKKDIAPYIETIKRREILKLDYHAFTIYELLEMLKSEFENIGKQIYKNNLVYYGFIEYIHLIKGRQYE